jgi:hypothetical protein
MKNLTGSLVLLALLNSNTIARRFNHPQYNFVSLDDED